MKLLAPALLAIAATLPAPAVAQAAPPKTAATKAVDPARLDAARHLIDQLNIDATLDAMFVQLSPNFAQAVIGILATDQATKAVIERLITADSGNKDRMIAILSQEFLRAIKRQYPALKARAADEYAAAFTADELNAIFAFYSSGPGAKALRLMPQLQANMSVDGQALGRVAGAEAGRRAFERIEKEMLPQADKKST